MRSLSDFAATKSSSVSLMRASSAAKSKSSRGWLPLQAQRLSSHRPRKSTADEDAPVGRFPAPLTSITRRNEEITGAWPARTPK
jgi:hypothetical protein